LTGIVGGIATFLIGTLIAVRFEFTREIYAYGSKGLTGPAVLTCLVTSAVVALAVGVCLYRSIAGGAIIKRFLSTNQGDKPPRRPYEVRTKAGRILLVLVTWLGLICLMVSMVLKSGFFWFARVSESPEVWILVFGPMAVLPAAVVEWCRPRWGGALLMAASVVAGEFAVQAGKSGSGYDEWVVSFGICTVTVPMMTLGLALLLTANRQFSLRKLIVSLAIVAVSCGYLFLRYQNASG
jgi:hypothetical protein